MVVPLLIAGASVGLSALYNVGKAYDNVRYWDDYYKRTGYSPKYPWRAGRFDYLNYASKALGSTYAGYRFSRYGQGKKYTVHHYHYRRY